MDPIEEQLALRSRLSDMAELPVWVEGLASRHGIPASLHRQIDLCLEEAVSNVIRHGYCSDGDRPVMVRFGVPREGHFVFVVDDEAPHFNPLDERLSPAPNLSEETRVGGKGILLLRHFTEALEYERKPRGNRLRLGFSARGRAADAE